MAAGIHSIDAEPGAARSQAPAHEDRAARLTRMATDNFQFIWRSLRRLGLRADAVDDAAQQVFVVAARKLDDIEPGRERAFLFMTAARVAAEVRRRAATRRELPDEAAIEAHAVEALGPDDLLEARRARALLDRVLDSMSDELRTVFVLFELERVSTAEIAALLGIPTGTAASRLRRAREAFHAAARHFRGRTSGGGP